MVAGQIADFRSSSSLCLAGGSRLKLLCLQQPGGRQQTWCAFYWVCCFRQLTILMQAASYSSRISLCKLSRLRIKLDLYADAYFKLLIYFIFLVFLNMGSVQNSSKLKWRTKGHFIILKSSHWKQLDAFLSFKSCVYGSQYSNNPGGSFYLGRPFTVTFHVLNCLPLLFICILFTKCVQNNQYISTVVSLSWNTSF